MEHQEPAQETDPEAFTAPFHVANPFAFAEIATITAVLADDTKVEGGWYGTWYAIMTVRVSFRRKWSGIVVIRASFLECETPRRPMC